MRIKSMIMAVILLGIIATLPIAIYADEVPAEYRPAIARGLEWLSRSQYQDGHWEATNEGEESEQTFSVVMTSIAGIAMLMEGSTIREGKYQENIRRAANWLMERSMPNGLIGRPDVPSESVRYIYGHGFAMLFLANLVGEEENANRRTRLVDTLERAVRFSREAQTSRGGWGYVSAKESKDFDEGSTTVTQLQALRAARNAGISVPPDAIHNAIKYLQEATNEQGAVTYSLSENRDAGSPALTAAALACGFSVGDYDSPRVRAWFRFCQLRMASVDDWKKVDHHDYALYYFGQTVYMLGNEGWSKLFPDDKEKTLQWSDFRRKFFDVIMRDQSADGSWSPRGMGQIGRVFATAASLSILQLDKAVLPIYQR